MSADIYWIEAVTQGRLAILGRPRSGDWLSDEIGGWKTAGLTDVVSLLEAHEVRDLDLAREADMAAGVGLVFESLPTPDRGVPVSFEVAHSLWNRLAAKILEGHSVGVHCRAGIGRSGLIAAGVLVCLGVDERTAWERTSRARGRPVPDTEEQRLWLSNAYGHRRPGGS